MNYKAVFHVDQNEEPVMNLALTNVLNLLKAVTDQDYDLVVLFNGPGVKLVSGDCTAANHEFIKDLVARRVRFQVCQNALKRFEIAKENVIEECEIIPAGIVALIDLQKDGFAYIKP